MRKALCIYSVYNGQDEMLGRRLEAARRIPVSGPPDCHGTVPRLLVRGWTRQTRICVATVFLCLAAMNITPVLNIIGTPLSLLAVVAAVFNPFAAFLYVAASQIAPDPPGLPLTLAQLFVAAWVATLPFNRCLHGLPAIRKGMRFMLPFIGLWLAFGIINETIQVDWIYAFITCAIICTYLPQAKGQYRLLLWMLVLGASLGMLGHWGMAFGLPMEGKVYEHFQRGGIRMGSGRADVNFASVNIGFALWTCCAFLAPTLWLKSEPGRRWKRRMVLPVILMGAVPLLSMGSRGGLGYLILGGITLGLYLMNLITANNIMMRRRFATSIVGASLILLILSPVIWPMFLQTQPGRMLRSTLEYNTQQAQATGSDGFEAGRAEIWGKFLDIALAYPLSGAPRGAVVNMGEYGYAVVGGEMAVGGGAGGTGHNVLIDIAAGRGFPTAILFAIGFAMPVVLLVRRKGWLYALPFAIAHVMVFLSFMNLSIANWKTFWALHAITSYVVAGSTQDRRKVRSTT